MRQPIPGFLMVLALLTLLAPAQEAMALDNCSNCQQACDYYCAVDGHACFQAVADCGTHTCSFQCSVGGWHWHNKRPIDPGPTSAGGTLDPATQVCAPPVSVAPDSRPAQLVEPESNAASKAESRPDSKSTAEPKAAPRH